jgi:uncharacterized surface protein with fasciclin (FAS1) repeats
MTTCSLNVYQFLQQDPQLSLFKDLVDKAGLKAEFTAYDCKTIFAPTNKGLILTSPYVLYYLNDPANVSVLRYFLRYHVYGKALTTSQLIPGCGLTMCNNVNLGLLNALYYSYLPVLLDTIQGRANVVEGNLPASGNYIHKIDALLQPEYVAG